MSTTGRSFQSKLSKLYKLYKIEKPKRRCCYVYKNYINSIFFVLEKSSIIKTTLVLCRYEKEGNNVKGIKSRN